MREGERERERETERENEKERERERERWREGEKEREEEKGRQQVGVECIELWIARGQHGLSSSTGQGLPFRFYESLMVN